MMNIRWLFLAILPALIFSCKVAQSLKGVPLTHENIKSYIQAYKNLRTQAPQELEMLNQNPESASAGETGYELLDKAVRDGGLKGYPEFVILNAKIGAVFSVLQARSSMTDFKNLNEEGDRMTEEGIRTIQQQLDNPEVPEETKSELRQSMKQLEDARITRNESFQKNEKIAQFVMKNVEKLTRIAVSESDIELVKQYEPDILEAYTGFRMPYENVEPQE